LAALLEREREREARERERERERKREGEGEREGDIENEREKERKRERKDERERESKREKERERERERERDRERFCAKTSSWSLLKSPVVYTSTVRAMHDCTNQHTQFQSVGIGGNLNTTFRQCAQRLACAAPRCKPDTHVREPRARAV